jgi:hypothetical protein
MLSLPLLTALLASSASSFVAAQSSTPSTGPRPLYGNLVLTHANQDAVLPLPFEPRAFDEPYVPASFEAAEEKKGVNLSVTPHFQVQNSRLSQGVLGSKPTIVEAISIPSNYFWAYEAPIYYPDTDVSQFALVVEETI